MVHVMPFSRSTSKEISVGSWLIVAQPNDLHFGNHVYRSPRMAGVVEVLIHKIEYGSDSGSLCDPNASIITEIILMIP